MKKVLIVCFMLLFAIPAMATDFNCKFPPYGETIDLTKENKLFLKHLEKEGITYYRYTGQCELHIQQLVPHIDQYFGFIDNKVYCNILSFYLPETLSVEEFENFCFDLLDGYVVEPAKRTQEGDWRITKCKHTMDGLVIKFKFNQKTRQGKVGWYYTPLKKKQSF